MKIGFAKQDITPRVGVELCGFGAYLHRASVAVRDRLWARAMAVSLGKRTLVLVSLDLVGVPAAMVARIRRQVRETVGVDDDHIMIHATHTHSGPATCPIVGWGEMDVPYLEILPHRIAAACVAAVGNLRTGTLSHAEVPCEGIGLNREQDRDAPPLEEVLRDDWRPAKPELTDTTCHVLRADSGGKLVGFVSYFGCHPVVCCQQTRSIHGDYPGVATNLLEREFPGSVGLFLQGAEGDVNSCVVHKPENESLLALDVIAARYANSVRRGLGAARPLAVRDLAAARLQVSFRRKAPDLKELRRRLSEYEALFAQPAATDADGALRLKAVFVTNLRKLIARAERGERLDDPAELQGFRIGPLGLMASPFETFQAIKNDVRGRRLFPLTWVMSVTNDFRGYAPDRKTAARGGYAADQVPMMIGELPYAAIHDELVNGLVALGAILGRR